ncbi:MAG: hypothetical protein PWQ70_3302 [Clostridiales bacterium]|jgi:hypothetical protein|nr:hypothetical protein [Clostridiales bacterium]
MEIKTAAFSMKVISMTAPVHRARGIIWYTEQTKERY